MQTDSFAAVILSRSSRELQAFLFRKKDFQHGKLPRLC
jgi:hypothetical protein